MSNAIEQWRDGWEIADVLSRTGDPEPIRSGVGESLVLNDLKDVQRSSLACAAKR